MTTQDGRIQTASDAVPLRMAVLCADCECVTRGLSDQCMVCGSHSLLGLDRLLGGSQVTHRSRQAACVGLLDVEMAISLHQVEPRVLNAAVEAISNLLARPYSSGSARIHLNVEPAAERCTVDILRAA